MGDTEQRRTPLAEPPIKRILEIFAQPLSIEGTREFRKILMEFPTCIDPGEKLAKPFAEWAIINSGKILDEEWFAKVLED